MTGRTHDAIAFASLITVATLKPPVDLNVPTAFAALVGNVVGGMLPDIDQASNRLWDMMPAGDYVGKIFRRAFLGHRTLTHSLLGVAFMYKAFNLGLPLIFNPEYINPKIVFDALMIGYISHLVGDSLTKEGIPLFFPLKLKIGFPPLELLRIKTDSFVEKFMVMPSVGAYIFWFIGKNQEKIAAIVQRMIA